MNDDRFPIDRRSFLGGAAIACMGAAPPGAQRRIALIEAPSNLGLRPLREGHEPGAWRGPAALVEAGLAGLLQPVSLSRLPRPHYRFERQSGSTIRNGPAIRRFSEELAVEVRHRLGAGAFPLVLGGDCSILLGCLHGAGRTGLIHVDGHSDFYHPGNYDSAKRPGSVAGMDLALATGRGEPLLARWDGNPLVEDRYVVQIGERDELDADYDYRDIEKTEIRRIPVRCVLAMGIDRTVADALAPVAGERLPLWLHIDLDVLDARVMPAVDSPGRPGLGFDQLASLITGLLASGRVIGADATIYDPELDPTGQYARAIVSCLGRGFGEQREA